MLQPDLLTSGGILETHKIGRRHPGVRRADGAAHTPARRWACYANVHCAAATENFLVLENHAVDKPDWGDIVANIKPIINKGYVNVPDGPGLRHHAQRRSDQEAAQHGPGYFEPTPQWDLEQMNPGRGGPAPGRARVDRAGRRQLRDEGAVRTTGSGADEAAAAQIAR